MEVACLKPTVCRPSVVHSVHVGRGEFFSGLAVTRSPLQSLSPVRSLHGWIARRPEPPRGA